jgi:hypothetical protein
MSSLKAWTQDPDDWKITYTPTTKKKTILQKLEPWLITIGFILFVMLANWFVETFI